MTPTQLRAYACVVRHGSVKDAARELGVTESAVSMNLKQLRGELDDPLFSRTPSGLAFTPGGLRLASRAREILDLQRRTAIEVTQAGQGRRMLRLASSEQFAEHAAPGLIGLFTSRARDLDVELSIHPVVEFPDLLDARAVDVALGPLLDVVPAEIATSPFLAYEVVAVAAPDHAVAGSDLTVERAADEAWNLGPGVAQRQGELSEVLDRLRLDERRQRIFQSNAAALAETRRGTGLALAVGNTVREDLRAGRLVQVGGRELCSRGTWATWSRPGEKYSASAELIRFVSTPRATQAMIRGEAAGVGRFRPAVHVTLWS